MDMRKAKRIKRIGEKNLVRNYRIAGWNARPVVAIEGRKIAGIYPSASEAGRKTGIYRWFWESDNTWCNLI